MKTTIENGKVTVDCDPEIVFALYAIDAPLATGDVVNGANLRAGDPKIGLMNYLAGGNALTLPAFPVVDGEALSGTWKAMGSLVSATQLSSWGPVAAAGYFVRVS